MTGPNLAQIANRHWSDAFAALVRDLGGEFRRFGAIDAFLGNLPLPFANGCLVLSPAQRSDLESAVSWVRSGQVHFQVRVDATLLSPLSETIAALGLVRDLEDMPAMVLWPIPGSPPPAPGITVASVQNATYGDFLGVLIASGIPAQWAAQIFPERLIGSSAADYFLAALDGAFVGISVAVRTGASGGIYSVATLEEARRRGVGSAVTWAALRAIRDWGCTAAVLQSSAMGYRMYQSMGFREVVRYARFTPGAPNPGRSLQASQ